MGSSELFAHAGLGPSASLIGRIIGLGQYDQPDLYLEYIKNSQNTQYKNEQLN
jgi:hypothetical protein